jgi:hypothetical protein
MTWGAFAVAIAHDPAGVGADFIDGRHHGDGAGLKTFTAKRDGVIQFTRSPHLSGGRACLPHVFRTQICFPSLSQTQVSQ